MIVLITGSRKITNGSDIVRAICHFEALAGKSVTGIIHGAARGVDQLSSAWAKNAGIPVVKTFPVLDSDWASKGKKAGYLRNQEMLESGIAQACLAIWDGSSRGTKHMIDLCQKARDNGLYGMELVVIYRLPDLVEGVAGNSYVTRKGAIQSVGRSL